MHMQKLLKEEERHKWAKDWRLSFLQICTIRVAEWLVINSRPIQEFLGTPSKEKWKAWRFFDSPQSAMFSSPHRVVPGCKGNSQRYTSKSWHETFRIVTMRNNIFGIWVNALYWVLPANIRRVEYIYWSLNFIQPSNRVDAWTHHKLSNPYKRITALWNFKTDDNCIINENASL